MRSHWPLRLLASLRQRLKEILPVDIVHKDVLTPVPAAHHVIHRAPVLDAQLLRHVPTLPMAAESR